MKIKIYFIFIIFVLFLYENLFSIDKTNSAVFLRIYSSPRIASMAGTGSALSGDISNNEINPSSLYWIDTKQIYLSYTSWFEDIGISYLAIALPIGENRVFGISAKNLEVKDIEGRDINGNYFGIFGASDSCYILSFMQRFFYSCSFGFNIKFIKEKIDIYSDTSVAGDIGFLVNLSENFTFACAARNIGDDLRLYKDSYPLPLTYTCGIGFKKDSKYNLEFGLEKEINCDLVIMAGLEIFALDILNIRLGSIHRKEDYDSDDFTMGFGINLKEHWALDYAYLPFQDLDNSHRFAIKYNF